MEGEEARWKLNWTIPRPSNHPHPLNSFCSALSLVSLCAARFRRVCLFSPLVRLPPLCHCAALHDCRRRIVLVGVAAPPPSFDAFE